MEIAIAHPHSRGGRGIVIRIQERPDLRPWAQDKVKEAMDRARQDSKPRKISMTFEQHSDWGKQPAPWLCMGCNKPLPTLRVGVIPVIKDCDG